MQLPENMKQYPKNMNFVEEMLTNGVKQPPEVEHQTSMNCWRWRMNRSTSIMTEEKDSNNNINEKEYLEKKQ